MPIGRGKGSLWVVGGWAFLFLAFFFFSFQSWARDSHRLLVVGSGDSEYLTVALGLEFQRLHPDIVVVVPPSIHTGGGIKAVMKGEAHLARISRPLLPHEKGKGIKYCFFAKTPVVFAVHPTVQGVTNLDKRTLVAIYHGKIRNWKELGGPDHKIYVVQREPGDSCRTVLERYVPDLGRVPEGVAYTAFSTPEALMVIEAHNYTIGYLPMAAARAGSVRVLALERVAPTLENLAQSRYKYYVLLGVAYKEPLSPKAKLFMEFLSSDRAKKIMRDFGSLPIEGCSR